MRYIAFTGGGTGGHIYPGLAVADELRPLLGDEWRILWIGSNNKLDRNIVTKSGSADSFVGIPSGKLRRYFSLKNLVDVFKIIGGFFAAFWVLATKRPVLLFSKGGFVSVPPCYAAKLLHIPVFTHECDVSPGLATRLNSKCATGIFVSFEKTTAAFSPAFQKRVTVTGNPVRPVFYTASAEAGRNFLGLPEIEATMGGAGGQTALAAGVPGASGENGQAAGAKPILLVLGGSLGAREINELVTANLDWLTERFFVVHQTGAAWKAAHPETFSEPREGYFPYEFIYAEMPHVMKAADVVLSRAGSNFLWECAVTAKPLVLIPLSGSGTRGDQVENAAFFESQGAAIVLGGRTQSGGTGPAASAENLKKALETMADEQTRAAFSRAISALCGGRKPAETIANILSEEVSRHI